MAELAPDVPDRSPLTPYAASVSAVPYTQIRQLGELAMSMDGVLRLYFGPNLTVLFTFFPGSPGSTTRSSSAGGCLSSIGLAWFPAVLLGPAARAR